MKRLIVLAIIMAAGIFCAPTLFAQDIPSDEAAQQTVVSCQRAQNYLKNIQKPRDLRGRVDRLQAYRYIYQRLNVFVIRLEKNDQYNARELRESLDTFNEQITVFKDDYELYDRARDDVSHIENCQKNNQQFTAALSSARQKRQLVHEDVLKLDMTLSPQVSTQLDQLYQHLLVGGPNSGASNE
jgi:hypothetical protein